MAKIVPSELAPDGVVRYSLANVELEIGPGDAFEVDRDDTELIGNAEAHPWLAVEFDEVDQYDPEDNRIQSAEYVGLAVQSGLDQKEPVIVDDAVAVTLAADPADNEDVPSHPVEDVRENNDADRRFGGLED